MKVKQCGGVDSCYKDKLPIAGGFTVRRPFLSLGQNRYSHTVEDEV